MVQIGNIKLPDKPILLAPMEDVTDYPFRQLCKMYGADLMFTEFISADALTRKIPRANKKIQIFDDERPIGIQLYGKNIEAMQDAAKICTDAGADLIDINFGCPVKKIACKGAGAGMLQNIPQMLRITEAVINSTHLPVTVKTRLSWDDNSINITEIAPILQQIGVKAISIHGRTRMQLYKGEAKWYLIKQVKENPNITIPIFGNGDITTAKKAQEAFNIYKVDGVMIGRGAIGKPWIFKEVKDYLRYGVNDSISSLSDRINVCITHLKKATAWHGERGLFTLRQHYSKYFKEIENSKALKIQLMEAKNINEAICILETMKKINASLEKEDRLDPA